MKRISFVIVLLMCSAVARAGLNGQTVQADWFAPDLVSLIETHNVVVGPGVELPTGAILFNGNLYQMDLSDTEIRFDFFGHAIFSPATFNGWVYSDLNNTILPIINVKLGPMSAGISNLSNSDLTFDANAIYGNFESVNIVGAGDFFTLEITFGEDVPEPASCGLLALAGFGLSRRRR